MPALAPSTWRSPASPRNCQTSSHTWAIAWAGTASPKHARPPLGLTGIRPPIAQVCELVWQLRGEAGDRQVEGAKAGITANQGLFGHGSSVICTR